MEVDILPVMIVIGTLAIFTSSISAVRVVSVGSLLPSAATSIGGTSSSSSSILRYRYQRVVKSIKIVFNETNEDI